MRMLVCIHLWNLPFFSSDHVYKMTKSNECKPCFYSHEPTKLIKATQPMEHLQSCIKMSNLLPFTEHYLRFFPFLKYIHFAYIHSDQGAGFMIWDLKKYSHEKAVASSHATPYNPRGNGSVEQYNGTIWKVVTLALKTRKLPHKCWEIVWPSFDLKSFSTSI